jgi:hypothetical protein
MNMNSFIRLALPVVLLTLSAAAFAQQRAPVLVTTPQAGTDSNINLQTNTGSACAAPAVGNCGSCSITCPTGHTAMCKPGLAVNNQSGASCLNPPECKCQ